MRVAGIWKPTSGTIASTSPSSGSRALLDLGERGGEAVVIELEVGGAIPEAGRGRWWRALERSAASVGGVIPASSR